MGKYTDAVLPQELHLGLAMLGTLFVSFSIGTVVLFGVVGFSWAASAWIPYAFVGAEVWSSGYFTTHAYEAVIYHQGARPKQDLILGLWYLCHSSQKAGTRAPFPGSSKSVAGSLIRYGCHILAPSILQCSGQYYPLDLSPRHRHQLDSG